MSLNTYNNKLVTSYIVTCCMCLKKIGIHGSLIPLKCQVNERGKIKHRICQSCWWSKDFGFGRENISHSCPGCVNGLPYPDTFVTCTIDLTVD
jgi:hypothetical protein